MSCHCIFFTSHHHTDNPTEITPPSALETPNPESNFRINIQALAKYTAPQGALTATALLLITTTNLKSKTVKRELI